MSKEVPTHTTAMLNTSHRVSRQSGSLRRPTAAGVIVSLLFVSALTVRAEDITLTTYYPSPRGVYEELRTTGDVGVGNINTAPAARLHVVQDGASAAFRVDDVGGGDPTPFVVNTSGDVGIGTATPQAPLDVEGGVKVGFAPDPSCGAATEGMFRWHSADTKMHYCDGAVWQVLDVTPLIPAACSPAGVTSTWVMKSCSSGFGSVVTEGTRTCTCIGEVWSACSTSC